MIFIIFLLVRKNMDYNSPTPYPAYLQPIFKKRFIKEKS